MAERRVVEETGEYYPGMVVASKDQATSQKGGVSTFNNKTGRTEPNLIEVKGEREADLLLAELKLKLKNS